MNRAAIRQEAHDRASMALDIAGVASLVRAVQWCSSS